MDNNNEVFTLEEVNLMCIFDTATRTALIRDISEAMPVFQEPELIEIAENIIGKLSAMTDAEFLAYELYPEYDDNDSDDEYAGYDG